TDVKNDTKSHRSFDPALRTTFLCSCLPFNRPMGLLERHRFQCISWSLGGRGISHVAKKKSALERLRHNRSCRKLNSLFLHFNDHRVDYFIGDDRRLAEMIHVKESSDFNGVLEYVSRENFDCFFNDSRHGFHTIYDDRLYRRKIDVVREVEFHFMSHMVAGKVEVQNPRIHELR